MTDATEPRLAGRFSLEGAMYDLDFEVRLDMGMGRRCVTLLVAASYRHGLGAEALTVHSARLVNLGLTGACTPEEATVAQGLGFLRGANWLGMLMPQERQMLEEATINHARACEHVDRRKDADEKAETMASSPGVAEAVRKFAREATRDAVREFADGVLRAVEARSSADVREPAVCVDDGQPPPEQALSPAQDAIHGILVEVLEQPQRLVGMAEPPLDALWGFFHGSVVAMGAVAGRHDWADYWRTVHAGSRHDHALARDRCPTFAEKLALFRTLAADFRAWLEEGRPGQHRATVDHLVGRREAQ